MSDKILRATHSGPLKIGSVEIPSYVLEDGTRVLSIRGISTAFTGKHGGGVGVHKMPRFLHAKGVKSLISQDLMARILSPIEFNPGKGRSAFGCEATLLPEICEVILDADKAGDLKDRSQAAIADTLMRGFARIGIIALVDEATGYQEVRDRMALAAILDRYLRKEAAKWAKKFPDDFYKEMFRLRGWAYDPSSVKRPSVVAKYTDDLVYKRIAPGLLQRLQALNPKDDKGRRKRKHFQWMTEDIGDPALTQHIHALVVLMRSANEWDGFYRSVQRALPKQNETDWLVLDVEAEEMQNLILTV
jgi:hypothetical protein